MPTADLRDSLAAERTFLAWIRTGLALMGFGFVVARFGLFLRQLEFIQHAQSVSSYGLSLWFGTALIVLGVFVNLLSAWHHLRLVRELNRGGPIPARPSTQAVLVALFLALVGLAMAIYLVSVHNSDNQRGENENNQEVSMTPVAAPRGIIDKPSNHSVEQTVEKLKNILQSRRHALRAGRSQRRSGEGGHENAFHQAVDLRQSESRYSADAGGAQYCHRSPTQDSGLGR